MYTLYVEVWKKDTVIVLAGYTGYFRTHSIKDEA